MERSMLIEVPNLFLSNGLEQNRPMITASLPGVFFPQPDRIFQKNHYKTVTPEYRQNR